MKREQRTLTLDMKLETRGDQDTPKLVGYAARFDEVTKIAGIFNEVIRAGAFAQTITDEDDVRALHNHNEDFILGRTASGTLRLSEDDSGLRVEIDPPDTQQARDLMTLIERGDVSQMSFGFQVIEERWSKGDEDEPELRELLGIRLFDVSTVVFPAYKATSIGVRSAEDVLTEHLDETGHEAEPVVEPVAPHEGDHLARLVILEDLRDNQTEEKSNDPS